jgi:protein-disulfide isomerase
MNNRFVLFIVACIIGFAGLVWFTKKDNAEQNNNANNQPPSSHVYGENKKGVTLVEYGDFECPACGAYFPVIQSVKEKYKSDISFRFVNFPLTSIHQNAMAAHRAAEAAGKQGKFFEMHDLLYERQSSWKGSSNPSIIFEDYAANLGLNIEQFKTDAASADINGIINADLNEGKKLGVDSTPTFFLEGKKLAEPPRDIEGFSKLIDEAIASKK